MLRVKCADCDCVVENGKRVVTCAVGCCCSEVPASPFAEVAPEAGIEGIPPGPAP